MKEEIVGLKDLRHNVDRYAKGVARGREYIVTRKNTPLFKLVPPESESEWETVIDFAKIKKSGISANKVLAVLRKVMQANR